MSSFFVAVVSSYKSLFHLYRDACFLIAISPCALSLISYSNIYGLSGSQAVTERAS